MNFLKTKEKKPPATPAAPVQAKAQGPRRTEDLADGNLQLLDPIPASRQVTLRFENISGWVPKMFAAPGILPKFTSSKPNKEEMRQIMFNITGACEPGTVLAFMGPSGSGKTSLLSVLGGRTPPAVTLEGKCVYNDAPLTKRVKRKVGFVLQDDLLYESLTVYETLYFAAMLRLPSDMSRSQKIERVETVIKALGLTTCRNTIIGGAFQRGVSGGERKRVSVGHELLIDPSVMMLDEPTSGLDSTTALHLLRTLRTLASGGRCILTTIHQPASRLYQMLDRLLLLSKGHVMYYGQASAVAEWFDRLGYQMPFGVNAADFILDMASGEVYSKKLDGEESRLHCIQCTEHYLPHRPAGFIAGGDLGEDILGSELWGASQSRRSLQAPNAGSSQRLSTEVTHSNGSGSSGIPAHNAAMSDVEMGQATESPSDTKGDGSDDRWGASYGLQLRILFTRMLKTRRFEALGTQDVTQFVVVGVLSGLFWLQKGVGAQGNTLNAARNINGLLFFEMMFMAMRAMLSALFTFPPNFRLLLKERQAGMYRVSAFYFARMTSDLPVDCTLPTVFIILVYFMGGLRLSAGAFFANWAAVLLLVLVAQSFGLCIGALVPHPKTAQTITTVAALSMVLVAGFFVTDVPVWIGWLRWISFIFYGYNLLQHIQYHDTTYYNCSLKNPENFPEQCPPLRGSALQSALGMYENPDTWPWEALALIAFLIGMRAMVYFSLRLKTRTKIR